MRTLPNTVIGIIEELEVNFPPRCMQPDEELNAHLRYAGQVDLVATLRARYDAEIKRNTRELPKVIR